jgi:hypothetical protein
MATTTRHRGIRIGGRTMTVPSNSETTPNRSERAHFRPPPGFRTLVLEATMTELNSPVKRRHSGLGTSGCLRRSSSPRRLPVCRRLAAGVLPRGPYGFHQSMAMRAADQESGPPPPPPLAMMRPQPPVRKPNLPPSYDVHIAPTHRTRGEGPSGGSAPHFWVIEGAPLGPVPGTRPRVAACSRSSSLITGTHECTVW